MGESVKAILQFLLIATVIATVGLWAIPQHPDAILWGFRIAVPLIGLGAGLLLWRNWHRKEMLPDLLSEVTRTYFERDGLCFAPGFSVVDGLCYVSVFFQNRYSGACTCKIILHPPKRSFSMSSDLPAAEIDVQCGGGEFGVVRIPYSVPARYQGRQLTYTVGARTRYPQGAGQLLRFRPGLRCGATSNTAHSLLTVALIPLGVFHYHRSARVTLKPPAVSSPLLAESEPATITEILWRPDLPTGGFPVIPAAGHTETSPRMD